MSAKLKRVIIESEDGTVQYIEGEQAREWDALCKEIISRMYVRNPSSDPGRFGKIKWMKAVVDQVRISEGQRRVTYELTDEAK